MNICTTLIHVLSTIEIMYLVVEKIQAVHVQASCSVCCMTHLHTSIQNLHQPDTQSPPCMLADVHTSTCTHQVGSTYYCHDTNTHPAESAYTTVCVTPVLTRLEVLIQQMFMLLFSQWHTVNVHTTACETSTHQAVSAHTTVYSPGWKCSSSRCS